MKHLKSLFTNPPNEYRPVHDKYRAFREYDNDNGVATNWLSFFIGVGMAIVFFAAKHH